MSSAVVLVEGEGTAAATEVAERILDAAAGAFHWSRHLSYRLGQHRRGPATSDSGDAAELLRRSDFACTMAKGAGKGRYQLFDAQVHDDMVRRAALKAPAPRWPPLRSSSVSSTSPSLTCALERSSGGSARALAPPDPGRSPPADFITLAEETGAYTRSDAGAGHAESRGRQLAPKPGSRVARVALGSTFPPYSSPVLRASLLSARSWPTRPHRPTASCWRSPRRPWPPTPRARSHR